MPLLCPECHHLLDESRLSCSNSHLYGIQDGVLVLLTETFAAELAAFEIALKKMRTEIGKRITDPAIYDQLPCARSIQSDKEWRERCMDLRLIRRLIVNHYGPERDSTLTILDVGAYNGWLSHNLARLGHLVTGIEYFRDPFDGLGAVQYHSVAWRAIQMDLLDLSVLDQSYDVVIMNHGLHFFPNSAAYVKQLLEKVSPGGLFVAIGLRIWADPSRRQLQVERMQREFFQKYGQDMLLRPAPGYLAGEDKRKLRDLGLQLRAEPQHIIHNVLATIIRIRPWQGYALASPI